MYDIKQFRPALYFLLLLGITGFAVAVEAPGVWLLAVVVIALHGWLVRTARFRPFPRLLANLVTLLALLYTFQAIRFATTPIITIGQFLVFLHLVKLFELRGNRDYAQLLILSLLLMVAGAISTPSLLFGVMFIVHLFSSLYVCMLFHLKVENDHALAAQTLPREQLDDATVKQDQRYLPRSMRRLAVLVSLVAVVSAVGVFLFFPRNVGAGMFGQLQLQPRPLTGFSDEVSLGQMNGIAQNTEIVAQVQLWRNDRPVAGTETLLLRGQTHDVYDPNYRTWRRSGAGSGDRETGPDSPLEPHAGEARPLPPGDIYRQRISLRPTGTPALFALPGVLKFTPSRAIGRVRFFVDDETIAVTEPLTQRFDYEVLSRNVAIDPFPVERPLGRGARPGGRGRWFNPLPATDRRPADRDAIDPMIAQYARRPDVSGVDAQGQPLAAQRAPTAVSTDLDRQIALNIEHHLRANFNYTLDLSAENKDDEKDPIVQFLYDWRKGHCTYFASSMVLMCQSLGLQARMVTGFRCDEYDGAMGDYYVVRQSHAHAWVEVRTAAGWQTFDPTSGNDLGSGARSNSAWKSVKHFFDWLEYKWAEKVVAYDGERRGNLISNVESTVVNAVLHTRMNPHRITRTVQGRWDQFMQRLNTWLNDGPGMMFSVKLLIGVIGLLALVLVYGLFTLLRRRHLMRRRAARIGLDNLPNAEQMRLARQLGFYEQLTTLLERRRIVRPRHQTPAEFSDGLTFLPNEAYNTIRRLTGVFYSIRFGRQELQGDAQRDLEDTVRDLDPLIDGAGPTRA